MADYLFDFEVRVFLGRIVVEQRFEVCDEIVLIVGYLHIGHDYVVGGIGPIVFIGVVDSISFAREVQSL